MKVNFVDLGAQYKNIKNDVLKDIDQALTTGAFMGSENFEKKFAEYHGSKYCVGVGSGTDALILSLLALGIGPGDAVIVPANTYIATAFAVSHTGADPIFVDVNPDTYTMDVKYIDDIVVDDNIGPRIKAIIPVHLYGQPAHMDSIIGFAEEMNWYVVEDCAQSIGAVYKGKKTGTFGDAGCYSFYPAKNLGGLGQGGAVITNDEELAETVRELGNIGRARGSWFDYKHVGYNSRLDAVNAKFLERGLREIDNWNDNRRIAAYLYDKNLKDVKEVVTPPTAEDGTYPVFHLYELKTESKEIRDDLKTFLTEKGVATSLHYPKPCHLQDMYKHEEVWLPISEQLSDTLLSLPMHPNLKEEEVKYVCDCIKEFFSVK